MGSLELAKYKSNFVKKPIDDKILNKSGEGNENQGNDDGNEANLDKTETARALIE